MAPATRLLYVDDEPTLLEIAKIFLEAKGDFIVDTLTSANEALVVLTTVKYDAIISDYQMPDMDGITFLKKLKASGNTTPFIIFTGRGREEIVIQALNEGADFYLQKGGEPRSQFAELAHKIHQAVHQREAAASIRDLERREADIINFLPDATFAIDTQGVVIAWNRAMEKMTGVAPDRILGKGNYEYSIPFYHERRPILIDLVLKDDPVTAGKYPAIKRDGTTLFSEITIPHFNNGGGAALWFTATPLYDTQGNIIGAIESIREITERVQVKEALRESEKRFRELSDLLPLIIYETDTCGNLTYANHIAFEQFGYSEEEFRKGLNVIQMIAPVDRERAATALRAMSEGRKKTEPAEEYLALRKDGSTFHIVIYSSPVFVNDRVTGLRGIILDVTERKRAEDAIRESEKRYRNIVEDQTEFISRFLPDGTHIFVNEAYCRYFGVKRDDILGQRFQPDIPDNDRGRVKRFFKSLTPDHPVDIIEHRIIMKDGSIRWQRWSDRAIFNNAGKITEYQSVGRDVTDKKDAEFALQASEERYRSIVNDQTDLIARFTPDGVITFVNEAYRSFFAPLLGLHDI
jgi:PAS domain S-box-containing protein